MSAYRDLRLFETTPDNYVEFTQRQRQWAFSVNHPLLWRAYRALARLRCFITGHDWSPCIEHEKFCLPELGRSSTHCNFCGAGRSA
jgi:hypothetical protein